MTEGSYFINKQMSVFSTNSLWSLLPLRLRALYQH